jgi:ABC-type multidrug transport system ATPase subunit
MTLFLTSHDPSEVARLADRVAFLKEGALVFTGTLDAFVREAGSVHQAYLAWVGGEG